MTVWDHTLDPLKLSATTWTLRAELWSSERALSALTAEPSAQPHCMDLYAPAKAHPCVKTWSTVCSIQRGWSL